MFVCVPSVRISFSEPESESTATSIFGASFTILMAFSLSDFSFSSSSSLPFSDDSGDSNSSSELLLKNGFDFWGLVDVFASTVSLLGWMKFRLELPLYELSNGTWSSSSLPSISLSSTYKLKFKSISSKTNLFLLLYSHISAVSSRTCTSKSFCKTV